VCESTASGDDRQTTLLSRRFVPIEVDLVFALGGAYGLVCVGFRECVRVLGDDRQMTSSRRFVPVEQVRGVAFHVHNHQTREARRLRASDGTQNANANEKRTGEKKEGRGGKEGNGGGGKKREKEKATCPKSEES
jgi:hypothetical protein